MPRNDPFSKWELLVIRFGALILLVIAVVQVIAPEVIKFVREIVRSFP